MGLWYFWIDFIIVSYQHNPPRFIEFFMLTLSIIMLVIASVVPEKPYLILGLSFLLGSSVSTLVREAITPSQERLFTQITALLLFSISIYGFVSFLEML